MQPGPILEVVSRLVWDEVRPEDAAGEWPDVKVEIVDLVLTLRVSKDVESYETERGVMPLAVNAYVLTPCMKRLSMAVNRWVLTPVLVFVPTPVPSKSTPPTIPLKSVMVDGSAAVPSS